MRRFVRLFLARDVLPDGLAGLAIDREDLVLMHAALRQRAARLHAAASPATPTGIAVSTKMRSFQTTGDDDPRPGISTFHLMFFVSLHSIGGFAVRDTPVMSGPRHCAQFFGSLTDALQGNGGDGDEQSRGSDDECSMPSILP